MHLIKMTRALILTLILACAALAGCTGPTGGDRCENNADCDNGGGLQCVSNFQGSLGSCGPNTDQPLICQTPCQTDADCADAEYGHKEAPKCIPDCAGNKACSWVPGF